MAQSSIRLAAWMVGVAGMLLLAGCDREPAAVPASQPAIAVSREINEFLAKALADHGYVSRIDGDWVSLEGSPVRMNGSIQEGDRSTDMVILELVMRLRLGDDRIVTQQVVGWGKNRDDAINQAQVSFVVGTFHAWLGAFVDPAEEHAVQREMTIGGQKRIATFGNVVTKVVQAEQPTERGWLETFDAELSKSHLLPGMHWIDLYHAQINMEKEEMEIQLDGKRWVTMERVMQTAAWPKGATLVSVRQFVVIQDVNDPTRPKSRPTTRPATQPSTQPAIVSQGR